LVPCSSNFGLYLSSTIFYLFSEIRLLNNMKQGKADSIMVAISFLWGLTFIFTKLGIQDTNESLFLIIRFAIACFCIFIFFPKHLRNFDKQSKRNGLILGLLYGAGFLLQTYGLKYTTVPKSAFITGLSISFVPFVYWILERKSISIYSILAVAIATIGLYLFTNPEFGGFNIGDLLTLISTIFWALYITLMDTFTRDRSDLSYSVQLTFSQFFITLILSVMAFFLFDVQHIYFNFSKILVIALIYNGIMASFLAAFLETRYQRYTTPVKAALIFSLEPIIASVGAIFVFNSVFSPKEIFGVVLILSGIIISELSSIFVSRRKELKRKEANEVI
ncbi:DMT family transporter, partial [bacterium]|nr:DMT family transporter [bacterium]